MVQHNTKKTHTAPLFSLGIAALLIALLTGAYTLSAGNAEASVPQKKDHRSTALGLSVNDWQRIAKNL